MALIAKVGFIRVRVGPLRRASCSSRSFGLALVHYGAPRSLRVRSDAPWGRQVHSGLREFTRVQQRVVGFIRVCVGSLRRAKWPLRAFGFARFLSRARRCRRVHPGSRVFTGTRLGVVGDHVGSFVRV